jgi:hypothetical protein
VVFAAELSHRGQTISEALETRRAIRRSRRGRHTRYRKPRFDNRRSSGEGWLPPSLESRTSNVLTWVQRLSRVCPLTAISMEVVNVTSFALYRGVQAWGLPVECGSGGLTKYNRMQRDLPKAHWGDAACVGKRTPLILKVQGVIPLLIAAQGHGSRQMCNVDRYGFPKGKPKQAGRAKGFRTGGMVHAHVPTGARKGPYTGRVLVRARGSFDIVTKTARGTDISYKYCRVVQRAEGYRYALGAPLPLSI